MKRITDVNDFDVMVTWGHNGPDVEVEFGSSLVDLEFDAILTIGDEEVVVSSDVIQALQDRIDTAYVSIIDDPTPLEWEKRVEADSTFAFLE